MRIFYASETTPNAEFSSNLWRNNLYQPLVDLGHDVVEFDYDIDAFKFRDPRYPPGKVFIDENRPKLSRELLKQIQQAHKNKPIDIFFSYFYDAFVEASIIDEIRSMGIKTINWYCNGSYQLNLVAEISPHYDWCLVPEKFRLEDYKSLGAHPIYSQEAANPNIYKSYDLPVEFDVTFVGQAYGERPAYIHYLLEQGIDIRVWGFGWDKYAVGSKENLHLKGVNKTKNALKKLNPSKMIKAVNRRAKSYLQNEPVKSLILNKDVALPANILGGVLADDDMIKMYSRSKINLGFSICGNTHKTEEPIMQVRLRDFEVPMSGGFYMVAYMKELEEFFDIGKEIICYDSPKDMVEKIKYFLNHDDEREQIRKAGQQRCLKDHTWHKRVQTAFAKMGLT